MKSPTTGSSITLLVSDQAGEFQNTFRVPVARAAIDRLHGVAKIPRTWRGSAQPLIFLLTSGLPHSASSECDRPCEVKGEIVVLPQLGYVEPDGLRRWLFRLAAGHSRVASPPGDF